MRSFIGYHFYHYTEVINKNSAPFRVGVGSLLPYTINNFRFARTVSVAVLVVFFAAGFLTATFFATVFLTGFILSGMYPNVTFHYQSLKTVIFSARF